MNLESLIQFLTDEKNKAIRDFVADELAYDDDTVISVELSFGELDQIMEILTAFADASDDEDWEDDEDEE